MDPLLKWLLIGAGITVGVCMLGGTGAAVYFFRKGDKPLKNKKYRVKQAHDDEDVVPKQK